MNNAAIATVLKITRSRSVARAVLDIQSPSGRIKMDSHVCDRDKFHMNSRLNETCWATSDGDSDSTPSKCAWCA